MPFGASHIAFTRGILDSALFISNKLGYILKAIESMVHAIVARCSTHNCIGRSDIGAKAPAGSRADRCMNGLGTAKHSCFTSKVASS